MFLRTYGGKTRKWPAIVIGLAVAVVVIAPAEADASTSNWHNTGHVRSIKVQAGKDTSSAFARKVANRLIMRNSCEHIPYRITSPTTHRAYRLRCLTIHRPGVRYGCQSCGWTVITWGGPGDNGSTIRVRMWFPGQVN